MLKKIILASALAVVSSFAAWDLFPVLENHKGQTMVSSSYMTTSIEDKQYHSLNLYFGSRYTVIPNLELALIVPYHVFSYYGGNKIGTDGTGSISLFSRYQFIPTMNVFADIYFPNEGYYEDPWYFNFGLQFSRKVNQLFNFGSQLSVRTATKGEGEDVPLSTSASLELDFTVTESFAPYIRTNGSLELGAFSDHGYQFSHGGGDLYLSSTIGVKYDFNETISIDASGSIGKVVNEDDSSLDVGAALAFLLNF